MRIQIPRELEEMVDCTHLPCLPTIAGLVVEVLGAAKWTVEEVGPLIRRDPVLAGHLLRVANSPPFGGRRPLLSIADAMSQIGTGALKGVLLGICNKALFKEVRSADCEVAEHALVAALACRHLAPTVSGLSPEQAYVAGLLHDVGKNLFLEALPKSYTTLVQEGFGPPWFVEREERVVGYTHAAGGAALALGWGLPTGFARALFWHHELEAGQALVPAERRLCLLMALGDRVAHGLDGPEALDWETEPAAVALGLGPRDLESVVGRVRDEFELERFRLC